MRRGDVYLVDFDPSVGSEIRKTRPALIISCNEANRHLKTVTVIPFSSKVEKVFPFEVLVEKSESGLDLDSKLKIPQMRAVDKSRLSRRVGTVGEETLSAVEKAVRLHLDME
jgi:mRNA interferase MazF